MNFLRNLVTTWRGRAILAAIGTVLPGVQPLAERDVERFEAPEDRGRELAGMLGLQDLYPRETLQARVMRPPPGRDYNAWSAANQDFLAGRAAILWTSTAYVRYLEDNASFRVVAAPLPKDVRASVPTGGALLAVLRGAPPRHKRVSARPPPLGFRTQQVDARRLPRNVGRGLAPGPRPGSDGDRPSPRRPHPRQHRRADLRHGRRPRHGPRPQLRLSLIHI